jgi:hypothetical protein
MIRQSLKFTRRALSQQYQIPRSTTIRHQTTNASQEDLQRNSQQLDKKTSSGLMERAREVSEYVFLMS